MNSLEITLLSVMTFIVFLIFLYLYRDSAKHQKIAQELGKEVEKVLGIKIS